ncbi:MAG TPA: hypothetical protein VJ729_04860 [Nitrososphaeraceae archaeon]|nr:hypothetical protein [Nitrososphaeraceae archaeon]
MQIREINNDSSIHDIMDDIIYRTNTGIKSSNTYNGLFSIDENGKYELGIFSPLKPTTKTSNLEFITGEVDPNILNIHSSAEQVIKLWEEYEIIGFPLEDIAQSLYQLELIEFIRTWQAPPVTLLAEVIVLLDSINRCKQIKGFNVRLSKDKRKLLEIIESRNKAKKNLQKNRDVYEKIYTLHNEYATASYINEISPIELTDDINKPDFKVIDSGIMIDTKMRLANDKPAYKDTSDMDLTNQSIFSLLMKDGFAPLQKAFDDQNADIAMVNLSVSSYGFLLSTGLIADSNFRDTITMALNMVKNKEKAVIFYTLPRGTISGIFAICFKRSIVDNIGGELSRTDSQFYRLGTKKNFSEFAAYVNALKPESLNNVDNGGLHIRDLNATDTNNVD